MTLADSADDWEVYVSAIGSKVGQPSFINDRIRDLCQHINCTLAPANIQYTRADLTSNHTEVVFKQPFRHLCFTCTCHVPIP